MPIPGLYPIRGVMGWCHLLVDTGLVGETFFSPSPAAVLAAKPFGPFS
jgi:hypothetical protein